jgi:small-conductance mechanosensitive channel
MHLDFSQALTAIRGMIEGFIVRLPYLVIAVLVYAAFHLAAVQARGLIHRFTQHRRTHRSAGLVVGRLTQGALMLLGVLVALVIAIPSFKPAQLIQILGIGGVAIGFAFRDILQNFLAGILILLTEPFQIGDQIVAAGFEGTVDAIETRATYIRTYDGRRVVIPNTDLFTAAVTVNTAFPTRRLQYDIGIGYGDDIAHAKQVILRTMQSVDGVLADPPPEILVIDLSASTVDLRVRWWINPPRRTDVVMTTNRVLHALKDALTAEGIDLPFPTNQILFHNQTEEADGDRARQREGWPARQGAAPPPPADPTHPQEADPADPRSPMHDPSVKTPQAAPE